jgi:hypothetical protein
MVFGLVRVPCLIIGIVVTLLFMTLMVTCRTIGLPLSEGATTFASSLEAPQETER